jgi:type III restriction enzyme
MAKVNNIMVINDEAHHAWRVNPEAKTARIDRQLIEEATKWVGGLDRIHKTRKIHRCFDFSATPFSPSGKQTTEESLFSWIVSDFGLNDAIEGGLVKTPRVVVRDDGMPDVKNYKSKLYHIYDHVRDDLSRGAEAYEPLPDLVMNAYLLLGKDWLATYTGWMEKGYTTPPVMITVANRTETAARVKNAFDKQKVLIDELCKPELTLHIDSKVLDLAEAKDDEGETQTENGESEDADEPKKKLTKAEQGELLRKTVDTVGKTGEPGEQIRNVISVGMLSEGWDAKTVTHIMGLRAFSSQLLCEQVVGRGLRRTSYEAKKLPHPITGQETELFDPEYVNIFGVPFTFLPHEGGGDGPLPPPPPKTRIEAAREKVKFLISWPNIIRIDHVYRPKLDLDLKKVAPLTLDAADKIENAEMAAVVAGKPNLAVMTEIDLQALASRFRMQKIVFEVARDIYDQMQPAWRGNKENLLAQVVWLVERFIASPMLAINPPLFYQDEMRRRLLLTLNMSRIVSHIFEQIKESNTEKLEPVFDSNKPIRATADMLPWFTGKPVVQANRSHINLCVADSTWEAQAAYELDHNPAVAAWAKNDHLGFEITYIFAGIFHKFRPDFLIRLTTNTNLVMEIKGQNTAKDQTKRRYLDEWVKAVNAHGGFGKWATGLCLSPSDLPTEIQKAATAVGDRSPR